MHWEGNPQVTACSVLPLMQKLTFNIICSLLFGIERGERRDQYVHHFQEMIEGMWSIPVNLPALHTLNNSLITCTVFITQYFEVTVSVKRGPSGSRIKIFLSSLSPKMKDKEQLKI
ncbi:unnamed protein product [Coffea canephora]|uniref:Uncharacterized protein n=1 Tax=Coffea canephora TaxID=49390 RepID=A0A068UDR6_COFCA|nr:unnamed protein product [Coffea canephora]